MLKVDNSKFLKFMTTHPPTVVNTKTIQAKQAAKKADDAAGVNEKGESVVETAKPAAATPTAEPKTTKKKSAAQVGTGATMRFLE